MGADLLRAFMPDRRADWLGRYARFDIARMERLLKTEDEAYWHELGRRRALALFHAAAARVPAYRKHLISHTVRPDRIRTAADLASVPPTDKENYIDAYPLHERCWDGRLNDSSLVAMSSGTSGEPKFWPRGGYEEFEAAVIHELTYRALFDIRRKKTLLVIGFPMGVYVSGVATLLPSWLVAQRGYDLTVVSVGNVKAQMLRTAAHLHREYDQVVLVGHPFFIKDVIETGAREGVDWKKIRPQMLFCSEGFSEGWRTYVMRAGGLRGTGAFSTYGSSETLLVGHETAASIALRGAMERSGRVRSALAGTALTPSVFQYNPLFRYVESVDDELLFTSASGIPLIRFNLHDGGRIVSHDQIRATGVHLPRGWNLPFVTLNGRTDQTMVFYAANIYPEHIHLALNHPDHLRHITGKFAMRKDYLKNMDEFLEINVELQGHAKPTATLTRALETGIMRRLEEVNMEYRFLREHLEKDLRPRVVLRPYQESPYFTPGLKPRYIVKDPKNKSSSRH